ncbi:MAG: hypothetical protein A2Y76_03600 [Planctomycetes bacterium RBG_13_60_9]|nr:MAG: hypothetical protein A2Y76_03600 [Planctomycetes bacterium RBG_13_60_9]
MDYIRENDKIRWVACFDLLGTRQLVKSAKTRDVFRSFARASKTLGDLNRFNADIFHAWFSDTFLIYSKDDSQGAFAAVEKVCRWFMTALIWGNIPVRGSISCGHFYSDEANGTYFGPALIEAYEWAESQDWIGLLLCPSCIARLEESGQSTEDYKHYIEYTVPPFMKSLPDGSCRCAACIPGNWVEEGGSGLNALLDNLCKMRDEQKDETVLQKYKRTIEFIERHQTRLPES